MIKVAETVVLALAGYGVERIFGVVGTSTLDIADAIVRTPGIEFVSARTEEGAAHMADGYARATGRVGVVLAHVGPGALRQLYGVGTAWKDSVPLVALTGNEVLRATDAQLREGYHVVDVQSLYRPITKATLQLRDPRDAQAAVRRALWLAASGRPGPVLLDLPKDVLKQEATAGSATAGEVLDRVPPTRPAPTTADVHAAASALAGARTPVIMAGGGVHWAGAHDVIAQLAEACNLPVVTTDGGRGAIPEDHPHCIGVVARQAGDTPARTLLAEADVILAVGTPLSDVSTFEWSAWAHTATVFQVDVAPEAMGRGMASTQLIVADAAAFLIHLHAELGVRRHRCAQSWVDRRAAVEHERAAYLQEAHAHTGDLVSPWTLIAALDAHLPRDAFISVDSGMHSFYGKKLRVLEPRTYIRSAGFGAMGYTFPALMGALEGVDGRRAVAIMGDGCLAMCLGEFETAARLGSSLTVVVCNDSRFASQLSHQHRRFDSRVVGTRFLPTDFVKIAEAQGVPGWTVESDDQAREAIAAAMRADGPNIIDARIDPAVRPATWIEGSGDTRLNQPAAHR